MIVVNVCTFSQRGDELANKIFGLWNQAIPVYRAGEALHEWTKKVFEKHGVLLFIGACGIAVRAIAPYVEDKLKDSPVIVIDEAGEFVIPILSGHMGGANQIAREIASLIGAKAVITTSTDVNGVFSVDIFAKNNGLHIVNREGIAAVSSKVLASKKVTMTIQPEITIKELPEAKWVEIVDYAYTKQADIIIDNIYRKNDCYSNKDYLIALKPKNYVIGMGCKKGKSFEQIKAFVTKYMDEAFIRENVVAVASIDVKANEIGIIEFANYYKLEFVTFSAQQLSQVKGDFSTSEFVKNQVGVDNVCERAAKCYANENAKTDASTATKDDANTEFEIRKKSENGITLALVRI